MSNHIPPLLLTQFLAGDLEEPAAVALAKHLDACPQCALAATAAEPLRSAFASTVDPELPSGLEEAIQAAALQKSDSTESPENAFASTALFLLAAVFLLAVIVSPVGVVNGGSNLLAGVAHRSESIFGRKGQIAIGVLISLGIVWGGIRWRRRP
jgi:anti-sigma factor RsiW